MKLFKKSDEEELPELPSPPEESKPSRATLPSLPELPTMPKNQFGDSMSMQAIKSSIISRERSREVSEVPEMPERHHAIIKEPVFVKIEKFQDAVKKFEEIKKKFVEIEDSLSKMRDLKEREEEELKAWESETGMIREKIDNIDNSLFNKISLE